MTEARYHPGRAAAWMMGSVISFSAIAVAGKNVEAVHNTFEILMYRSAVGFLLVVGFAWATGRLKEVSAWRLEGHFLRNSVHFVGQNLWFWAIGQITLAQVFALEFTSPIWVILLAPVFLGEVLTRQRLISGGLGFVGVLIVTHPWGAPLSVGIMAAAGAAVCFATVSIVTKRLTMIGISVVCILFWLTLMQFFFGLICAAALGHITPPTAQTWPWLVLIGIGGVTAHMSLTNALTLAPASYVVPIDFLRLPLIAVIGALAFNQPLDPAVLTGGAVIFAGVWLNLRGAALFSRRLRP